MYSSKLRRLIRTARPTLAASISPVETNSQIFVRPKLTRLRASAGVIQAASSTAVAMALSCSRGSVIAAIIFLNAIQDKLFKDLEYGS